MDEQNNNGGGFQQNQGGFQQNGEKKMYDVNEVCAKCGTEITKLPFPPDPAKKDRLQCRDCYRQNRPFRR
jgi:CxxC-x17-CxxC domain-containing protein